MVQKLIILVLLAVSATIADERTLYNGYKVYEAIPKTSEDINVLGGLSSITEDLFDFWKLSKIPNDPAHIMVHPTYQNEFENTLNHYGINYTIMIPDVEETFHLERQIMNFLRLSPSQSSSPRINFKSFHRFNEINAYLDQLAKTHSNRVTVKTVGKSYEGRELKTITITNGDKNTKKKTIFVDAGIHAREWIAPATALYIINQLVENFNENKNLLQNYNWIVLPVVNPDGYEYTHTKERLWRKTRKPNKSCAGTDGNRNFGFHWGETGASSNECSETFKGSSAFSEPETQVVKNILQSVKGSCKFYLTLHSYGQYLLYPWGWTSKLPSTWKDIDEVAQAGASAMRSATGAKYTVGSSTNVLYAAAGGSDDYAFGVENVPVSITMELPGNSFAPSASQIETMVKEAWAGIKAMAQKVEAKY